MGDLTSLLVSFIIVFAFIGIATLLLRRGAMSSETTRKVVHIGVSHWWLLFAFAIGSPWVGLAGAASFIAINYLSYRFRLFRAMENPDHRRNLGTVYFPVSLFMLILFTMGGLMSRLEAGVGILVLGWGDGMAAILGMRYGNRFIAPPQKIFGQTKSIAGTVAMVLFSSGAAAGMTLLMQPDIGLWQLILRAGATGLFAAMVELVTPFGLDNIAIPLLTALFYRFVATGPLAGPFAAAAAFNAIIAAGAFRTGAVSASGATVGAALGTAILVAGGFPAYSLLVGFFLSSTALGRMFKSRRPSSGIEKRGSRRDGVQVIANCGMGALASVLYAITGAPYWLAAFAASFASANADTWASEIGVLYRTPPISLRTGKPVPAGASGGVSPLGFLASALGAAFIGALFAIAYGTAPASLAGLAGVAGAAGAARAASAGDIGAIALVAAIGGFAGAFIDSLLGATLQAQYSCARTGRYTERTHSDGLPNLLVRGIRWIDNDLVNFAATAAASLASAYIYLLVASP